MRPRTRDAVSVLLYQIGSSTLHNQSGPVTVSADGLNRHATKDRIGICLQGRLPLRGVLDVFPSRLMRLDVPLGTLAERDVGPRRGVIDGENGSAIVRSVASSTGADNPNLRALLQAAS